MKSYKEISNFLKSYSNINEYKKLPKHQRSFLKFFYVVPKYIEIDISDLSTNGFETAFDRYFKSEYPIQYFLRDRVPSFLNRNIIWPIKWRYDKIHEFLFPRQKWLYKKIPNHWMDKDSLITLVIFESIIHFVEEEHKGINEIDDVIKTYEAEDVTFPKRKEYISAFKSVKRIYRWAKIRNKILDRTENFKYGIKFSSLYEHILEKYDEFYSQECIKILKYLWI